MHFAHTRNQDGLGHIIFFLLILLVAVIGFAGWKVVQHSRVGAKPSDILKSSSSAQDKAIAAGKILSNNQCSGSGDSTFTHLPMNESDFALLIPYGLTVGGHVTPIDHQYFSPTIFNSPKDTYPVYAMADSKITNIEVHPPENGGLGRIRMVFTVSCTFFYYYDLVTSVQPGIDSKHLPISVKAGQLIGHIGGQTLDFAVWDTTKPLGGFIAPSSYNAEPWKIYTADPFPYYSDSLRKIVESKDPRIIKPIAGKIDYDIDGKLIGNWFLEGTYGYAGNASGSYSGGNYWTGHLSIAPDLYDPSIIVVSVGNYDSYPISGVNIDTSSGDGSGAKQYFAKAGSPDPAKIGVSDGSVKFELVQRRYLKQDGSIWADSSVYTKSPSADNTGRVVGTVLAQLTDTQKLKLEVFPGKTAAQISSFDSNAKTYTR